MTKGNETPVTEDNLLKGVFESLWDFVVGIPTDYRGILYDY